MKKRERTSYAFLMEMMWVCAFFLICACIFVLAFAKAEQMSRKAETLNKATLAAENAMEEIYAAFDDAVSSGVTGVDDAESSGTAGSDEAMSSGTAGSDEVVSSGVTGFAAEIETIRGRYSSDTFSLDIKTDVSDGLLTVIVEATDTQDGESLCTLNGARAAALSSSHSGGGESFSAIAAEGRPL